MYVLIIENEKNPELKRIPNRLETLRKIVGNEYIDVIKYKDVLIYRKSYVLSNLDNEFITKLCESKRKNSYK